MIGTVRLPVAGLAACLVFGTACSKPDAKPAGNADSTAVSTTTSPGPKPLIAMVRAADWMGSEWSEDAIKLGLRESDMPYATPIPGLYSCSAGCHPAGSVIGAAGYNAARRIIRDLA